MSEISKETLAKEIKNILKGADLSTLSAKKIRKQLEEKHDTNLDSRKTEIDALVMKALQEASQDGDDSESDQSDDGAAKNHTEESDDSEFDEPEDYEPAVKKSKKKKHSTSNDDDEALAMELQEEENSRRTRTRNKKSAPKVKRKSADDGDKKSAEGGKKRKNNSYMKELTLSPELADIMGKDKMARSDVVKRMWQVIKERNLQDPKQKQFMLCDDQLLAIFGRKRVKTFGMMKYLNAHMFTETD